MKVQNYKVLHSEVLPKVLLYLTMEPLKFKVGIGLKLLINKGLMKTEEKEKGNKKNPLNITAILHGIYQHSV